MTQLVETDNMEDEQEPDRRLRAFLTIAVDSEFKAEVEEAAKYEGLSVSSFVRMVVTRYMRELKREK